MKPAVEVTRHSGECPWTYELLDVRQREVARRVLEGGSGSLLVSELAPVITYGRRTPKQDFLLGEEALRSRGVSTLATDRGGLATYHGPGQWVLFPVDRLEKLTGDPRGVRVAVERLLKIARIVAEKAGVRAEIREGPELGLWGKRGKLASVGIHVETGVLLHGLSLNVFRTAESFLGIRPCGLDAQPEFLVNGGSGADFEEAFLHVKDWLVETALTELWLSQSS